MPPPPPAPLMVSSEEMYVDAVTATSIRVMLNIATLTDNLHDYEFRVSVSTCSNKLNI